MGAGVGSSGDSGERAGGVTATHGTLPPRQPTHMQSQRTGTGGGPESHLPGGDKLSVAAPNLEMFHLSYQVWESRRGGGAFRAGRGASHTFHFCLAWKLRSPKFMRTFEKLASWHQAGECAG